jgi:hypothetical protein
LKKRKGIDYLQPSRLQVQIPDKAKFLIEKNFKNGFLTLNETNSTKKENKAIGSLKKAINIIVKSNLLVPIKEALVDNKPPKKITKIYKKYFHVAKWEFICD